MSHVGRQIGRYRILEQLGSGGMSVVYKGLDTALDREVAVKVLHPHLAMKDESRRRLAREAKAVAKLHHPNILEVFDFAGAEAEEAYIVTEYIRGQTLRQYATKELFEPPEVAAMVVHEIAAALAHAHEAGIIHRDLKPENVMVRDDGVLKLMDFGIAKIVDRDDRMTMTGALVGSPAHMAPEIIEGDEAGAEADIFSLGTMLYLFATGRLPFNAPNTTATLKKILDCVYDDPRQVMPAVSDDLSEIIATCLARQPSARYPNSGKLRDALASYLSGLGLARPTEELAAFFASPNAYRKRVTERLVEALIQRGERFKNERRPAKALSSLNQVLALQSDNPRALALLQQMNIAKARQRRTRTGVGMTLTAALVAAVCVGGYAAWERLNRPADYLPGGTRLSEVLVAADVFPAPTPKPELPQPEVVSPAVERKTDPAPVKVRPAVARKSTDEAKHVASVDPPKVAKVSVMIKVRPYGTVRFDTGEQSPADAQQVEMEVPPGAHRVTVTCAKCEPWQAGVDVPADGKGELHLLAKAKPARLRFNYEPANATVRIGKETRSAKETLEHPFEFRAEPGESIGYLVNGVEVSSAGYHTELVPPIRVGAGEDQTYPSRTSPGKLEPK